MITCTFLPPLFLQVTLPVAITPRCGHSAVVFGTGPSFRVVVLFGGETSSGYLSETTLLLLGEYTISATDLFTQTAYCNTIHLLHRSIAMPCGSQTAAHTGHHAVVCQPVHYIYPTSHDNMSFIHLFSCRVQNIFFLLVSLLAGDQGGEARQTE